MRQTLFESRSNESRWLRLPEAASYLRVSPRSLSNRTWREQRGIPTVRLGRLLLFDASQLDAWLNCQNEGGQA
jgi:excisionase family DNA binding protein